TLLQIIGLLDKPTSGTVIINGVEVNGLSDNELARFRNKVLGFVFQQYNLINRMSVLENIEIPLIIRGIPRSKRIEIVKEALMMVGGDLTWLTKKPSQLSGGQQQRVAIARAIVGNPEIILADEPTGNLDSESSKIIMETFVKLNKTGKTIIMVTHNPEIAMCSERIVLIRDGIIVGEERSDPSKSILYVKR
ncbi:MAG: ABC transporter ATP-binding protein, partial [Thermoprotei archaeon]